MNVLLLNKDNDGGGVTTHVINLANTLKKKGHNVYVVSSLNNGKKGRYESLECDFYPMTLFTKNIFSFLKNLATLKSLVQEKKIDIIHCHYRIASFYANFLSKLTGIPFIWTLHLNNIPSGSLKRTLSFYGKKAIVVSQDLVPFCVNNLRIPREDIAVGYNGVHEEAYYEYSEQEKHNIKEKYGLSEGKKVIVVLSRLDPVKGHRTMISAVERVEGDYYVLMTGESMVQGYKEELIELVSQKGLQNKIKFVGYVNPVDVLNISDLFVLPSVNEGFAITVIESFLMRVPVIRTKTGGYGDVKDYVFLMHDENDLAEQLRLFLSGKLDTEKKVDSAYHFALENCTCDAMTDKVLEIYEEVLKK